MVHVVTLEDRIAEEGKQIGYCLIGEAEGCVNGASCGVSIYDFDEPMPAVCHEDQEGFYVLEGRGKAWIDGEEMDLEPGMCFMVPAGVMHTMCRAKGEKHCKVLWFHAAV